MIRSIINKGAYCIISLFLLCSCNALQKQEEKTAISQLEKLYKQHLATAYLQLDSLAEAKSLATARLHYRKARKAFKQAEPVLSFADVENYRFLNQPNILKVDEEDKTAIKIKKPSGFQVIEEVLFADEPDTAAAFQHSRLTANRLKLVHENTYLKKYQPYHFLWLLRNAIQRTALTGITGFDSPVLENSLQEGIWVYSSLGDYLKCYEAEFQDPALYSEWQKVLDQAEQALQGDFNSFDRFAFMQQHTQPQLALWLSTVNDWQLSFPFNLAVNNHTASLFSDSTFNTAFFSDPHQPKTNKEIISLGKALFHDASLSASGEMSCASCHQEKRAFTDGKKVFPGQLRNSPTLSYAGLQKGFFYDKRAGSLEGQIVSVVNSKEEFHTDFSRLTESVAANSNYLQEFGKSYADSLTESNIRHALASYVRSLAPFSSRFDRAMNQVKGVVLTERERRGFNLFSGKAKCATCHFAPVFNGTVPPEFTETEMELLGVPATADTINPALDSDPGRYNVFQTEERRFFFKTPTVRNVARTAPYMHNGVYKTLEEVMDFYNRGGAAGLGIPLEYQTLPADPLNLSEEEVTDIIAFLNSLTDERYEKPALIARQ